jgi:hypothetical protein
LLREAHVSNRRGRWSSSACPDAHDLSAVNECDLQS